MKRITEEIRYERIAEEAEMESDKEDKETEKGERKLRGTKILIQLSTGIKT